MHSRQEIHDKKQYNCAEEDLSDPSLCIDEDDDTFCTSMINFDTCISN